MTVPRLLLTVGLAAGIAFVGYLLGTRAGQDQSRKIRASAHKAARNAWTPEPKKDRTRIQKLAKRNAKKIDKAVHH
ncbi:hypothetical protein [Cryobacterium arcticum]|uniref:Uncharacterized protein n=1 Tax=Cryobacterium arcticum TaxID=670052 RepID=A0A317ZVR2_9MICO|nr:hypothetical protein [Cryobacterium arcticum]PXA68257.1 hypothetical protein CTB96_16685 [Cryobacterium arcticum]